MDVSAIGEAIDAEKHAHDKGMSSDTHYLEQWFVDNAKVQINPGRNYGTGGNGHMRMNLGTPRPYIKRAIDNIASAISNI